MKREKGSCWQLISIVLKYPKSFSHHEEMFTILLQATVKFVPFAGWEAEACFGYIILKCYGQLRLKTMLAC